MASWRIHKGRAIMSVHSPWIALSIDWMDSEMFDGSCHGVRLAWVSLLCFAKAEGRSGKVRLRGKAFARRYDLKDEVVESMLERASQAGAIERQGDVIEVVNWGTYQWGKKGPKQSIQDDSCSFPETTQIPLTGQSQDKTRQKKPPLPPAGGNYTPDFERFWSEYPKRVGKKAAWVAWRKAIDRPDVDTLIAAVRAQAKSDQWRRDGGQYIPNPATWLNQGRWDDGAVATTSANPLASLTPERERELYERAKHEHPELAHMSIGQQEIRRAMAALLRRGAQ